MITRTAKLRESAASESITIGSEHVTIHADYDADTETVSLRITDDQVSGSGLAFSASVDENLVVEVALALLQVDRALWNDRVQLPEEDDE